MARWQNHPPWPLWPALGLLLLRSPCAWAVEEAEEAEAPVRVLPEAVRFSGRVQVLSGAGFALPVDAARHRTFAAYVPIDVEFALRMRGLFSLSLGAMGYLAPFRSPACPDSGTAARTGSSPSALAAFGGLRLDFNNSRDGSWLSPWVEMRVGLVGQDGVASVVTSPTSTQCGEHLAASAWLGPRGGLDLWLGQAAVTFAVGYDYLPRASALTTQVGLTLRLF